MINICWSQPDKSQIYDTFSINGNKKIRTKKKVDVDRATISQGKQSPQEYQRKKIQIVNLKVDVLQEHILKEEPITPIPEYIFLQNDTLKPYPQL